MKHRSLFNKVLLSLVFGTMLVLLTSISVALVQNRDNVHAVSATDFNAGKIIDDSVFYNKDSMNAQQIQDFLDRLIPNCDVWGTGKSEYGGGTRAQYAASRGWAGPPYVCVNKYYENPNTSETSYEKGGGSFSGGISASQIIYTAAQTYGINPQVLLVLLKKESSGPLTADSWPLKTQYKYAMGYACPDSGANYSANCDGTKSGFYKQMMLAAWQLKYYRDHPDNYRYAVGVNDIQYSTSPTCGTKRVNIENIATLSLYIYTPYTPNDAALANYPGTAACGSYGNRNFFMFFTQWFGTTYGNTQLNMLKADSDIDATYARYKTQLGNPTSDVVPDFNSVTRVWQTFERGTIIWTTKYGAVPVLQGSINDRWRLLGGSGGLLGVPIGPSETESSDGRQWQNFVNGTVIYSSSTGAWEVINGPINDKWRLSGGSKGLVGKPTSGVIVNEAMRMQLYENGAVVRKDTTSPAYVISGDTFDSWFINQAVLGYPTMDSVKESSDGRIWQQFSKGVVIDNGNGAWIVRTGPLQNAWKNIGGSEGILGKPVTNEVKEADGRVWQQFTNGQLIQQTSSSIAHPMIYGEIYDRWRITGGSTGTIGVPIGMPITENDSRVWQNFSNGTIISTSSTGTWEVLGNFYTYWKQHGGSLGSLGKPISARQINDDDSRLQEFEKGEIRWSPNASWSLVRK
jgi:uncharacterized protein with LGFP repeats